MLSFYDSQRRIWLIDDKEYIVLIYIITHLIIGVNRHLSYSIRATIDADTIGVYSYKHD